MSSTIKKDCQNCQSVQVKIASSQDILSWSHGEIKTPDTINYRTLKPEKDGLFCAQIFGPVKDYTCLCEKYRSKKFVGIKCDRCGVEILPSSVRRSRMAHIKLNVPVVHIWYFHECTVKIGHLLDIPSKRLESVIYYYTYIITKSNIPEYPIHTVCTPDEKLKLELEFGVDITFDTGGSAIETLLNNLDIENKISSLKSAIAASASEIKIQYLYKKLKVFQAFMKPDNAPSKLVMHIIPVLPADLRPLVSMEAGRFASSDLNELYKRIINRNIRLTKLMNLDAPDIILRNEKRMLQEAVDNLIDNKHNKETSNNPYKSKPLKSLTENIKGKQGRFRQNLLGKRVDYSGRSVITAGPTLKFYECGLPKDMAVELFKPFIYSELLKQANVYTIEQAKHLVSEKRGIVYDVLEKVLSYRPVLLNRAPTLHRLGIQAFKAVLINGKAIRIHPMVCAPFNADFDGDAMSVHVPITHEAVTEAKLLMLSTNNIFSSANSDVTVNATSDICLGLYNASLYNIDMKMTNRVYTSYNQVKQLYDAGLLEACQPIFCLVEGKVTHTTVGRILLSDILPDLKYFSYINKIIKKKDVATLISIVAENEGHAAAAEMIDEIMYFGFNMCTLSGASVGIQDMPNLPIKRNRVNQGYSDLEKLEEQYKTGLLSEKDLYNKKITLWQQVDIDITDAVIKSIQQQHEVKNNSLYSMLDSGARGSVLQFKQLSGMRGLMSKPNGDIIPYPIVSNCKEGLNVLEFFISTHGARKGLVDKALSTASAGYLTRRLVDVAQDIVVVESDCGTSDGIDITRTVKEADDKFIAAITGRVLCEDITTKDLVIKANTLIDRKLANVIALAHHYKIKVRSPSTCQTDHGICALCYGMDLATRKLVSKGHAVGVIAAQSIGEPGTQLTLRTFHAGGTAAGSFNIDDMLANVDGIFHIKEEYFIENRYKQCIVTSYSASVVIKDAQGNVKVQRHVRMGSILKVKNGDDVTSDTVICCQLSFTPLICRYSGILNMDDFFGTGAILTNHDNESNVAQHIVTRSGELQAPVIKVMSEEDDSVLCTYTVPVSYLSILHNGARVLPGDFIAFKPSIEYEQTEQDIVQGGLPRLIDIFEVYKGNKESIVSNISGVVYEVIQKGTSTVFKVRDEENNVTQDIVVSNKYVCYLTMGSRVHYGDVLTDGIISMQDTLLIYGVSKAVQTVLERIQIIFKTHGIDVHNKHFEIIIRKMLQRCKIIKSEDPDFIYSCEYVISDVKARNSIRKDQNLSLIEYEHKFTGITKTSVSSKSFLSAASFQETSKVLTEAAIHQHSDTLSNIKENVILGRIIPAGTGFVVNSKKDLLES